MEQRWRKQPCNTVIDCEFKPCYNVAAACQQSNLPFTDKYCREQKEWWNANCCPGPKPSCCRKRDKNKEICEKLGFHHNWACLRERIQKENNRTMEALTASRPNQHCFSWKHGGPYYSLSGPVYHPPGMLCTDYSLYIPTERLKSYCNRHLARFRMNRPKRRNQNYYNNLQTHSLLEAEDDDHDSLFEEEARSGTAIQTTQPESNQNIPISASTHVVQNFKPNLNGKHAATDANASVTNLLQQYGIRLDGTTTDNNELEDGTKKQNPEDQCPSCKDIGEDTCRKKVNNGNHFDDCTCRLCIKKKGEALAPKITDTKADRCRKLWTKTYQEPCSDRQRPCVDEPQEEINPETGDVICTKCANCPCPVCCKQRAYARIKPHHYYANGLSHPDLKIKRMSFHEDTRNNNVPTDNDVPVSSQSSSARLKETKRGSKHGSSLSNRSSSLGSACSAAGLRDRNNNICGRRPKIPDLDPSKFRYNDDGIENTEYYTGDCAKENPTRKSFGLDVTYRQCCCSEEQKESCKTCPSFVHAGTQYCHFPHELDITKAPSKATYKTKSGRLVRRTKKKPPATESSPVPQTTQPPNPSDCPQECMYDIRLPTPTDYNTTTYRESYIMPVFKNRVCNPGRFGSEYNPNRPLQLRNWEVYPMEIDAGQGDFEDELLDSTGKAKSDVTNGNGLSSVGNRQEKLGPATRNMINSNKFARESNNVRNNEDNTKCTSEMFQRYLNCCKD